VRAHLVTCGPGYTSVTALGGGIEAFPGTTVTVRHSVITANRAVPDGSVPSAVATCPGSVPCRASFGDTAGIDDWGAMTLIDATVSDNHAAGDNSDSGGIVVEWTASLSLQRSIVAANSASSPPPDGRGADGGGIFVAAGGSLTASRSMVVFNTVSLA
jgi:hypothetical protein